MQHEVRKTPCTTELGDLRRFDNPRQLMGYLGLTPSERSTGDTVRRGGITKAGNGRVRHLLIESTLDLPPSTADRQRETLQNTSGATAHKGDRV